MSAGNADRFLIIDGNPAVPGIRIVDKVVVAGKLQALEVIHAVHEFNVGAVPHVIPAADERAEVLHELPVVIIVKLVAVAPYIHEIEVLLFEQRIECLAVLEQAVLVMTGRLPAVRVFRQCEAVGGTNHAGVADAAQRQKPFDVFGQRAVGIAQAAYRIAGVFFQCSAVSQDFFGDFGQGTARDGRMRDRVAGDFMSAVEIRNLGRVNALVISEEAANQTADPAAANLAKDLPDYIEKEEHRLEGRARIFRTAVILEAAAGAVTGDKARRKGARKPIITPDVVSTVMDTATVRYDKDGDDHYDVISAFIKSMRGSDPDAAIHYLARMIRAGEDPRFIARRIMIAASEDVGIAAPQILQVTVAAAQAVALIGMPEARIILAEATIAVATAPKSNASYNAINSALADVDAGHIGAVPLHLRNAPTKLMKEWGNHEGYRYAHDWPGAVAPQQYMPDELVGREYYHPNDRGYEREVSARLARIRPILHGESGMAGNGGTVGNGGTTGEAG